MGFLISEFRRLGGIADNVIQRRRIWKGYFLLIKVAISIFTPSKLLVKKNDICIEGDRLRIKKDKEYNLEIRDFFNFYQDNFSWGSSGKTTVLFETGLSLFTNLRALIKKYL